MNDDIKQTKDLPYVA